MHHTYKFCTTFIKSAKSFVHGCHFSYISSYIFIYLPLLVMSVLNLTNVSRPSTNITMNCDAKDVAVEVSYIITIIFNGITCPFTVVLNVLVIMAVKKRPRLQSYTNILLACLAVTDVLTGLLVQPTFIIWRTSQLLGGINNDIVRDLHVFSIGVVTLSSALHLMLVTCERLIAIKYTLVYSYLVTAQNIKVAVTALWFLTLCCAIFRRTFVSKLFQGLPLKIGNVITSIVIFSCMVFMATSYAILYHETVHQQKKIKTQQLPQEEVERFAKERKTLRTIFYVVGTVLLCFSPVAALTILWHIPELDLAYPLLWITTFLMLNSLLNPLIYCWRQQEMRQFVFRMTSPAVGAVN